jgi:hypothetical protein
LKNKFKQHHIIKIYKMGHDIVLYNPEDNETMERTYWTSNFSMAVLHGIHAYHTHKGTCVARMIMADILYLREQGIEETDITTKSWSWGTDDTGTKLPDKEFNWVLHRKLFGMLKLAIRYPQCIWISDLVFESNDYTDNSGIIFNHYSFTESYNDDNESTEYEFSKKIPEYETWEEHAHDHEGIIYSHRPRIYEWLIGKTFYNGQSDPHYYAISCEEDIEYIIGYYKSRGNMENHITLWREIAEIFREMNESNTNRVYSIFPIEALLPVTLEA